jgi:hypothetical protein
MHAAQRNRECRSRTDPDSYFYSNILGKIIKNEAFFIFSVNSESLPLSRKLRVKLVIFVILCITTKT